MSGRFPGAKDVRQFWTNLRSGVEGIRHFSIEELESAGVDPAQISDARYVRANGVLEQMEWFDAGFFGMSPRDAAIMDPQTRHFLECAWHALEHAGHVPERFDGTIGVFAGAGAAQYFWKNVLTDPELRKSVGYFLLRHTGNDKDFVATRASYEFDLTGPSVGIQTACSTSLVAIHYACQSLLAWECDMALAGGVTIEQPHWTGYVYEEGEILSPDGHCRSFDKRAGGTVFGSGVGVVALRRLSDALEQGDPIHAVVRGTAINNDGAGKVSYLAPSVDGQAKAIAEALSVAGVSAETIGMVEAHGTATPVGDPIEVAALTQAFRAHTDRRAYCALGSVKSNIGHLDTAAGVASFIKAVCAVEQGEIPATLHFEEPNPLLQLDSSPFYVNADLRSWPDTLLPRRAAVSSLGVGGTNAHVVVEQAPRRSPSGPARPWSLLTLSGRSTTVLEDASSDLVEFLESNPGTPLADVSYTLRTGRRRFSHRRAIVCESHESAIEGLVTRQSPLMTAATSEYTSREVAFLFAGGGAQYTNMGRELYDHEPVFREAVDRCIEHFAGIADYDLGEVLFPDRADDAAGTEALTAPSKALPALFAIQFAQAALWMSWGIRPSAMIGHSMGEYTAACLAGVFTPEQGLELVHKRGMLFERLERGAMLSVGLGEAELLTHLPPTLSVAALNSPELSVASGPAGDIEALEATLTEQGVDCRRVRIDVAAHSSMLQPILPEFEAYLKTLKFSAPSIPVISNLTGRRAGREMAEAGYWVRHLRETVRFSDGVGQLMAEDGPVLLEVGPGRTLATLARMHSGWREEQAALTSLPPGGEPTDAQAFQLSTLGALWAHGVDVDWAGFDEGQQRRRVALPTYPFERQPHFVPPPGRSTEVVPADGDSDSGKRHDPREWFYQTQWVPTPRAMTSGGAPEGSVVLLLADVGTPGDRLAEHLATQGRRVVRVRRGDSFTHNSDEFTLRTGSKADWSALIGALGADGTLPDHVVHAWLLGEARAPSSDDSVLDDPFFSLLWLLQAVEDTASGHPVVVTAAANHAVAMTENEAVEPERALLLGPVRVAGKELPNVRSRLIDAGLGPLQPASERAWLASVADEVLAPSEDSVVALRGRERFIERFAPVPLGSGEPGAGVEREGVYLITGGLGGLGLVVARELAEHARASLVLVGRSALPSPEDRARWLHDHPRDDKTSRAIREVDSLEKMGAEVLVLQADVTSRTEMRSVIDATMDRFGRLDGVIHAAGVLDDAPLLSCNAEKVRSVMDAKVLGARALVEALEGAEPTLLMFFSSVSAVIGAPGQIDYAAANAYLDALARGHSSCGRRRVISVGWGAWRDVGMAAELAGDTTYGDSFDAGTSVELDHPLLDRRSESLDGSVHFETDFFVGRHWMLDEHRLRSGGYLIPGSGYVETIRAAHALLSQDPFALDGLVFLKPFRVDEGEKRTMRVSFTPRDGAWNVVVCGRQEVGMPWIEHATGRVGSAEPRTEPAESLPALIDRIGRPSRDERAPHPFMDFGPRWANVSGSVETNDEALIVHALSDSFARDVMDVALHPALLDMATAGAQHMVPGLDRATDFMVPAGYGRLRMFAPMSSEVTSHVHLRQTDADAGLASFDVTIFDSAGRVAVTIHEFSMLRLRSDSFDGTAGDGQSPDWLRDAIRPTEGVEVLRRLLANPTASHVLVATRPIDQLSAESKRLQARPTRRVPARRDNVRVPIPEVASALESHEAVREAAAIGTRETGEAARVVAFVAYEAGKQATVSELRRYVRKMLGAEWTPQNFTEMIDLPRRADGAISHESLRDPFATTDDFVAPRTPVESTIAEIWVELLGLDRVGIHDNFLDIGGHSLVGIRVLSRIHQSTGVRVEANALTLQTLEQLAAEVERAATGVAE